MLCLTLSNQVKEKPKLGSRWANLLLITGYGIRVIGCYSFLVTVYWLLVVDDWLLVMGYCLWVVGYWFLAIDNWLMVIGYGLLVIIGYWLMVSA